MHRPDTQALIPVKGGILTSMQQPISVGEMYLFPHSASTSAEYSTYACYLACIVNCVQRLYGSEENIEAQIAAEIAVASQDHIQFHFHRQSALSSVMIPYVAGRRGFLVRWGDEIYGSLQIKFIEGSYNQYVLPIPLCERLAQDCAWGLHILREEVQGQRKKQSARSEAGQKIEALSLAQRAVLELMVQGFSTRVIADRLRLSKRTVETHQRNIYQILEVHSQREAVLIGLAAGLAAI